MTLVELLVVVSIIVMLTAFALPVVTPSVESRRTREAARALNVFIGAARNHAMETGRPCGVLFQRMPNLNQATTTLYVAEVPPPYAGSTVEFRISVRGQGASYVVDDFRGGSPDINSSTKFVRVGDTLQLNGQGPLYRITGPADADGYISSWRMTLTLDVNLYPVPAWGRPGATGISPLLPVRIFRSPVPTAAAPLQLPGTVVVDMAYSGLGTVNATRMMAFGPAGDGDLMPVIVVFSPRGDVERVYYSQGGTLVDSMVSEPLYFLIGKQQRVAATVGGASPAEDGWLNWQDPSNLWVTVNPQTGLIKTTEVGAVGTSGNLADARRIAQTGQSMGGK